MKINLLPLDYRPRPQVTLLNLIILLSAVFLVIIISGMAISEFIKFQGLNNETILLQQQLDSSKQALAEFQKFADLKQQIDQKHQEVLRITDLYQPMPKLFRAIAGAIPDNLWLTKFNITADGKISIEGQTISFSLVGDFLNQLNELPIVSSSKLKTITANDVSDYNTVLYNFAVDLETRKENNNNAKN
jgi:Tfp pilus assembly protein PilN